MNKFDVREATVAALGKNKRPDCVEALNREFNNAVDTLGLSLREAFYYAEVTNFLKDHDGHNHLPELRDGLDTDEAIHADLQGDIDNNEYQDQPAYLLRWFDLVRTWDVPVTLAFTVALGASLEEWEDDNDIDEAEAIGKFNEIPGEDTRDSLLRKFYILRNEGNSVLKSVRTARDEVEEELRTKALFAALSTGFLGGGGLPN